ncbi:lysylphosphatidylglycerol synthase domain-containing protein [Spongiactinospora sp. TRM90649]|uniref:lysylphosphatidylglycerol synthase domain-containing protein n=1 Tax=Spongiactinospora sp. TRM90649 TaxID=3031114 RepID=UPI0023F9F70F|nr:lysylphosphatidylglycerol synthase domain-containing protein [Spongiactinospora sp. TRM90649]MDF5751180.1 lysylphosphatidylglycerol synthase domain-containing protein [Spongiactinospora sp. TRM90649]
MRITAKGAARAVFLVIALGFGVWAVGREWDAVVAGFAELSWVSVALSLAAVLAALGGGMLTWRALLADLGSPLPVRQAAKVFFVGQLGKYIPGSLWPVLAQMEMGRDLGVPRSRSAAAFFLTLPVQMASGLLVAAVTLLAAGPASIGPYSWALLLVPVLAVLLEPRVINALIGFGLRSLRREPLERPLTRRGMLTALGWALSGWIAYGLHLAAILADAGVSGVSGPRLAVFAVGAFALSWCLGIMTFVVPAGAGVRELAMVAVLSPVLPSGAAIAVALTSRIVLIAGDLVCAGTAALAARSTAVPKSQPQGDKAPRNAL